MDEMLIDDPCSMVLYEEEVTTAHEIVVSNSWEHHEKSLGFELTDTKCYKTPSGVQKTATIQREQLSTGSKEHQIVGEQQIVETDGEFSMDAADFLSIPSTSTAVLSAPSLEHQPVPLRRMAIKIGERVLRFKVINASDAPEPPVESAETQGWLNEPKPLTTPKALAGLFHCANCKTYFGNKEVYQRHMQEVHGDTRPFRCFNCGMRFANKTSMTHHLKDHSLLKPMYSCEYCPRIFSKLESRNRHHKLHFTRMTCQTCMRFFTTAEALAAHQSTAHPTRFDDSSSRSGGPAASSSSTTSPSTVDLLPNGKTARFNCSYCNLRFHFKKDMLVHERVHTGEKPYSCGYCGKAFAQSQALTAHIRTHTKEMPYGCAKCPKRFRDNSCLRKHELSVHTAEPIVRRVALTASQQQQRIEQRRKQHLLMVSAKNARFGGALPPPPSPLPPPSQQQQQQQPPST